MTTVDASTSRVLQEAASGLAPRKVSRTVEYWLQTLIWTTLAMILCSIAYCIEKYGFHLKDRGLPRMFMNPAEIAMRIFGLPHFIVGLFFMLSSKRMRTPTSWVRFVLLLGMGLGFASLFARFGAHRNPVMLVAFYFYFLIHGFRDEAFFYKSYGDYPQNPGRQNERLVSVLQIMMVSLLFAFLMPTYLLYVQNQNKLPVGDPVLDLFFPASVAFLVKFAWYLLPVLGFNSVLYLWMSKTYPGGWRSVWNDHHPLLMVFLWSTAIVMATLAVGAWTFNFVVLAHFVGWYLYALRKLETVPAAARAAPAEPLRWMRTTQAGFKTLHLGLAIVVTIAIAISTYVFKCDNWLDVIVGGPSFYYWTVLHVSLSFYPR